MTFTISVGTIPVFTISVSYLICTPVPQGNNGQTEDNTWPWHIPVDGISENVEGICPWSVAFWIN